MSATFIPRETRDLDDFDPAAPLDGQVPTWSGGRYVPATPTSGGGFSAQNKDSGTLPAGAPVAIHSSGVGIVGASAADASRPAIGILPAPVAAGFSGLVALSGPVTLADWTAATGATTLAARATYFLSATAGRLATTPPATPGQVVHRVGVAVAPDTLDVQVRSPILL